MGESLDIRTLPDYLKPGLDIVLVGLNPGAYSAKVGHYFASSRNRFWKAINQSGLFREPLDADNDHKVLDQGIGFTDVVKRPSRGASDLRAADFRKWSPVLKEKIERYQPLIVCFHGATGYRNYLKHAEGVDERPEPGLQQRTISKSRVFLIPNPSPANAVYSLDDLVAWYTRLKDLRDELKSI